MDSKILVRGEYAPSDENALPKAGPTLLKHDTATEKLVSNENASKDSIINTAKIITKYSAK